MRTALLRPNPPRARGKDADNLATSSHGRVWDPQHGAQTLPHPASWARARRDHVRPENTQLIVCTSCRTMQQKRPSRLDVRHCGDGLQQRLVLPGVGLQLSTHEIFMPQRAPPIFCPVMSWGVRNLSRLGRWDPLLLLPFASRHNWEVSSLTGSRHRSSPSGLGSWRGSKVRVQPQCALRPPSLVGKPATHHPKSAT